MSRGRLAPSPTGRMHIGNARTALAAWLAARSQGGRIVMRIEDLDIARIDPEAENTILRELRMLGIDWDEGPDAGGKHAPYRQSERNALYATAIARLKDKGALFPCACSRADIERAASAPHADDGISRYPGTCRDLPADQVEARAYAAGRATSLRFRGDPSPVRFQDIVHGAQARVVDDFVVQRADGTPAYQLAVVVDDAAMAITDVVRGDDLLDSTPRQIALYRALGMPVPTFAHVPLVMSPDGVRLAKRRRPVSIGALLDAGNGAERIIGTLAASLGLCPPGTHAMPRDLLSGFSWEKISRKPASTADAEFATLGEVLGWGRS